MSAPNIPSRLPTLLLLTFCALAIVVGTWRTLVAQQQAKTDELATTSGVDDKEGPAKAVESILKAGTGDYLALIELRGAISGNPEGNSVFGSSDSNAISVRKALDASAKDNKVKGVLLIVDSPGGTVGMSQELHAAMGRVREKKPVVVSMGDLAASGGYYTAVAADSIVANRGTLTASIGVIIHGMNLKGLVVDKLGVKPATYKSGAFKDMLSPYREARPDEVALIQGIVNESYADFLSAVLEGRTKNLTDATEKQERMKRIRAVADGRVVLGTQALACGLVDALGDAYKAENILQELVNKRFNMKDDTDLPLKGFKSGGSGILGMLGIETQSPVGLWLSPLLEPVAGGQGNAASAVMLGSTASAQPFMPFTMRHPNQPLWILESAL
jgi:protease IV